MIPLLALYPALEELNISHCTALSDKSLLYIAQYHTSLTVLKMDGCMQFSSNATAKIINLSQLQKLHVVDCKILDRRIPDLLKELKNLKLLKIRNPEMAEEILRRKSLNANLIVIE